MDNETNEQEHVPIWMELLAYELMEVHGMTFEQAIEAIKAERV